MEYKIRCCIYCGEGFEAHDGEFYCSDECADADYDDMIEEEYYE